MILIDALVLLTVLNYTLRGSCAQFIFRIALSTGCPKVTLEKLHNAHVS